MNLFKYRVQNISISQPNFAQSIAAGKGTRGTPQHKTNINSVIVKRSQFHVKHYTNVEISLSSKIFRFILEQHNNAFTLNGLNKIN